MLITGNKLKLLVLRDFNPYVISSASANRIISLLEGLAKLDITVYLLITRGYYSKYEKVTFKRKGNKNGINYEYLSTAIIDSVFKKRMDEYVLQHFLSFFRVRVIRKKLNSFDEVIIIWPSFSIDHLRALKRAKRPNEFYFIENNEFPDIHLYDKNKFYQRSIASYIEKYFESHILHLLDGMALMTKTLLRFYEKKVHHTTELLHLPMTVDLDRFSNLDSSSLEASLAKPYIVYIGSMNNAKDGVDILIKSFKRLSDKFLNHKLYLFGSWHYDTPGHLELIKSLGLSGKVFYKGSVESDAIPQILACADLLVLPRPDSHQAKGGFPTKLGEYLASGKPVCATNVGEIADYLTDGKNVFFAEPGSVASFYDAMERALNDPVRAKKVGKAGRLVAETYFNKDIQAQKLYQFFNHMITKKKN